MTASVLEFEELSRAFGRLEVLTGVSARVEGGGLLMVTGPNGCGKSTLLRCLAGLLAPDGGSIRCREGGRELDAAERRRRVGYVAPDLAFYEELDALENLEFFARLRRAPQERCRELARRLGVPTGRPAGALSSGQQQRLRWSWALLHEPLVLLLDEPYQNLDPGGVATVRQVIDERLAAGALAIAANPSPVELPRVSGRLELGA